MFYFSKSFLSFYNDAVTSRSKMPKDAREISKHVYDAMMLSIQNGLVIKMDANGLPTATRSATPAPAQESMDQQLSRYSLVLSNKIHDLAREWQYESSHDAATYVGSAVRLFAAEAAALTAYRDTAFHAEAVLAARIRAGTSRMPSTEQDFLSIVLPPTPARPTVEGPK